MKKNLLLLFGSLLVGLVLAEIVCRHNRNYLTYNERIGNGGYISPFDTHGAGWLWCYTPNQKRTFATSEFGSTFLTNEDGLKECNISSTKTGKRILTLGDSFTEGVGAPPDSSYPRILESLFRPQDSSIQVINAGIGGSDVFFEYKLLQKLIGKYKPDVVIETVNATDIIDYMSRGGFERFLPDNKLKYRDAPWFEPLYVNSFLVRRIVSDIFHYDYNFIRKKDYATDSVKALTQMCVALDSFQTYCALNHVPLVVMLQPGYTDFIHPEQNPLNTLLAHCKQQNITYIDELPYLQAKGISAQNWQQYFWPIDNHFKAIGYSYLALSAYQFLNEKNMLYPPS